MKQPSTKRVSNGYIAFIPSCRSLAASMEIRIFRVGLYIRTICKDLYFLTNFLGGLTPPVVCQRPSEFFLLMFHQISKKEPYKVSFDVSQGFPDRFPASCILKQPKCTLQQCALFPNYMPCSFLSPVFNRPERPKACHEIVSELPLLHEWIS